MKENELRNKVRDIINSWVGGQRGGNAHLEILRTYNNHKPLARGYAVQVSDAYCATTVSAAYIAAGIADYTGTECGVEKFVNIAQAKGIWEENDAHIPKVGDAVVYDWDDNGVGDCKGYSDHIGIVVAVNGAQSFTVAEGNMSGGKIGTRDLSVNGRYIRGFIVPDFAAIAAKVGGSYTPAAGDKSVDELAREVIAGSWGNGSDRVQKLKAAGYDPDAVQKRVNELLAKPQPKPQPQPADHGAFIEKIGKMAAADMAKSGILASLTIAQAILESGWGTSGLTKEANNLFGIKGEYKGNSRTFKTQEWDGSKYITVDAKFRAYPSWAESVADHTDLFNRLDRYKNLRGLTDYKLACRYVREDGYATDPHYTDKLIALIEENNLTKWDKVSTPKPQPKPQPAKPTKSVDEVAHEVIAGKWGNGSDRVQKLKAAGYNAEAVQRRVNQLLGPTAQVDLTKVAQAVIRGEYGNGADRVRRLKAAGYDPAAVQRRVNQLLR